MIIAATNREAAAVRQGRQAARKGRQAARIMTRLPVMAECKVTG